MHELGIIGDEIAPDVERSCALVRAWGMEHIELRTLWGQNVLALPQGDLERARRIVDEHGLVVTAIATPVFKSPLDDRVEEVRADFALPGVERFEDQLELLRRAFDVCHLFGTRMARVFTFWRRPWTPEVVDAVAERLAVAAEAAQRAGVQLAVENEPVCTVGTGAQLGELDDALRRRCPELLDSIALLWDPGNALAAGEDEPYPHGYEALRPERIAHVHLKDATVDAEGRATFVPIGRGRVDYAGQLRRLVADGYRGTFVLEPHYRPEGLDPEEAARRAVEAAREALDAALADGGRP